MSSTSEPNDPHPPGAPCCGACLTAAEVERSGVGLVADRGPRLPVGPVEVEVRDGLETKRYSFAAGQPILIGRGRQCDVVIDSTKVARVQCRVSADGAGLEVVDQGSGCGTFVNGRRVERAHLHQADQVLIADLQLRFRVPPTASAVQCSGTAEAPVA